MNFWGQNLGIDTSTITFETLEFSEYLPVLDNQEVTGPFRLGWGQDYPSPYNFLEPLYASYNAPPVGSNNTFYNNPDFDALLASGVEKVAASGQLADGLADYFAAEDLLCDDAQVMPIYFSKTQYVWSEDVSEVWIDAYNDLGYTLIESTGRQRDAGRQRAGAPVPDDHERVRGHRGAAGDLRTAHQLQCEDERAVQRPRRVDHVGRRRKDVDHRVEPRVDLPRRDADDGSRLRRTWSFGADGANGQQNNSFYSNIVGYDELNPEG